jgi:hypothetical protein
MRSMVEGASDSTRRFRRMKFVAARAPSTALRAVPLPRFTGAERTVHQNKSKYSLCSHAVTSPLAASLASALKRANSASFR